MEIEIGQEWIYKTDISDHDYLSTVIDIEHDLDKLECIVTILYHILDDTVTKCMKESDFRKIHVPFVAKGQVWQIGDYERVVTKITRHSSGTVLVELQRPSTYGKPMPVTIDIERIYRGEYRRLE